jgi:hypothetical protein
VEIGWSREKALPGAARALPASLLRCGQCSIALPARGKGDRRRLLYRLDNWCDHAPPSRGMVLEEPLGVTPPAVRHPHVPAGVLLCRRPSAGRNGRLRAGAASRKIRANCKCFARAIFDQAAIAGNSPRRTGASSFRISATSSSNILRHGFGKSPPIYSIDLDEQAA